MSAIFSIDINIILTIGHPMEGIELSIQIRAFPSEGRARVHESVLSLLGVKEGEAIEVKNVPYSEDQKPKKITLTIYADTMVEEGAIRISPQDVAKLAVAEDVIVHVQRKVPLTEKISLKMGMAGNSVKEGAEDMGESIERGVKNLGAKIRPDKENGQSERKPKE